METIETYLENMFANLPQSSEILRAKNELLSTMEEKYHALKREGKTENEAVGIVISEFGNIDELLSELGIFSKDGQSAVPVLNREDADAFLSVKRHTANFFAAGVFLCICAPAVLIGFSGGPPHAAGTLGLAGFFILVAIAVGLFVAGGMKLQPYEYLEKTIFTLDAQTQRDIEQEHGAFHGIFTRSIVIGVSLCILSPLFVITLRNSLGVVLLLLTVACAIYLFVRYGCIRSGFDVLLQKEDYSIERKKGNRVLSAVAAVWWPLVTIVFLIWGLVYHGWAICWIVWPIGGLLFAVFSGAYSILTRKS